MRVLITGHNGFVGKALVQAMSEYSLHLVGRTPLENTDLPFFKKQLSADENYRDSLEGVNVIIHAAARVHVMDDTSSDPLAAYRAVNVEGTLNLAQQAINAGVKRFIFISSIKVNGEATIPGKPFSAKDKINPSDPYGISKAEAEQALQKLCVNSDMDLVIIRPPLVYGYGVKANFAAMLKLAKKNLPLPLGAITNRRSMVALDNLIDLIKTCVIHPQAANQIFLVSDDRDLSTTELVKLMVEAHGKSPRLLAVPMSWFYLLGKLTRKQAVISRLCGSLQVDINATKSILNWQPPVSVEQGIRSCIPKEDLC